MTVKLIEYMSLEQPFTLADMEQFVLQAKEIGVPLSKELIVAPVDGRSISIRVSR